MSADIAGGAHQSPEPPKGAEGWGRRLAEVVVLAILAVLLNLGAPTFFLDTQVMLGGSLAVYALLRFGWIGLVVGLASLAVTWFRWGHPIGVMVGMLFFLCLAVYLGTGDGGRGPAGRTVTSFSSPLPSGWWVGRSSRRSCSTVGLTCLWAGPSGWG